MIKDIFKRCALVKSSERVKLVANTRGLVPIKGISDTAKKYNLLQNEDPD